MKVQLVSKTQGVGKYENLTSEEIVAAIARHGVIKEDKGKLVRYLMDHKHWSPLDMINFTFEIETSRAIARQILRHSSIKPQEHSQRYSDKVEFEEVELRREHPTNRQSSSETFNPVISRNEDGEILMKGNELVELALQCAADSYEALLKAGVAKEQARMILPECTKSIISMNGTLRSWLSFLNVRLNEYTQKECRLIAEEILLILKKELPNVFSNIDTENGLFM